MDKTTANPREFRRTLMVDVCVLMVDASYWQTDNKDKKVITFSAKSEVAGLVILISPLEHA
jgi:hypothetical protein